MYCINKFLVFICLIKLAYGSDLRVVPTWNSTSSEESVPVRYANHDRVVPHIDISPLGVHHDSIGNEIDGDTKRQEKIPPIVDSNEDTKFAALNDSVEDSDPKTHYPTPRARIQEDVEIKSDSKIPTPRPRIQASNEQVAALPASERSVRSSLEDDDGIVRDDPKPFAIFYRTKPIELDAESSKLLSGKIEEGQPEEILVIQDVNSTEEDSSSVEVIKQPEISNDEIQRYIDEIDREFKEKNPQKPEVKDTVVDSWGLRKYVVKDNEPSRPNRFRREAANSKSATSNSDKNSKIPPVGNEKIENVHEASGGLSYNVGFEDSKAKGPKPTISSPRHKREASKSAAAQTPSSNTDKNQLPPMKNDKTEIPPLSSNNDKGTKTTIPSPKHKRDAQLVQVSDNLKEDTVKELTKSPLEKDAWFKPVHENTDLNESSSESEELTSSDKLLPKTSLKNHYDENQKTFDEVLHKSMKDHEKKNPSDEDNKNVYTQEVQRLPHKGPTLKTPATGFLAVDPPLTSNDSDDNSTSSESDEIALIVVEKTITLEDDENRTQNIIIEDSDVKFNLIQPIKEEEEQLVDESASFWQNGFTIGLHVSPLAMCLFTLLILAALILRLTLKIHKKRLEHKADCQSLSIDTKKKHHEFDDVSLQTVSTS